MAELPPHHFPNPSPAQNVNYDFQDVLTNSAYIILYGHINSELSKTLIRQRIDTDYQYVQRGGSVGSAGMVFEDNYDYAFAVPQKVDGLLYIRVIFYARASGVQTADTYLKFRILHFDGTTETEIAAQKQTPTVTETADGSTKYTMSTLAFTVDRNFKIGEKLRVEIQVWTNTTVNSTSGYLVDPADKDYGQIIEFTDPAPSDLTIYLPLNPDNI